MVSKTLHRADTRGKASFDWLTTYHTFSFADYHNPERIRFGALRVLNDDTIAPGGGFGMHPHRDMEIITILLQGALRHEDSEGNKAVIRASEVQVMSAGTGVHHSEVNASATEAVSLFQIWILPKKLGIAPRYDQKSFAVGGRQGRFETVVSPLGESIPGVQINQDAYLALADLKAGESATYEARRADHGLYLVVIEGNASTLDENLERRDALGITGIKKLTMKANAPSSLLVIEVPML